LQADKIAVKWLMIIVVIASNAKGGTMTKSQRDLQSNALVKSEPTGAIIQIVLDTVDSEHTRRVCARALNEFMTWYHADGLRELNKATVQRYAAELRAQGVSAASINGYPRFANLPKKRRTTARCPKRLRRVSRTSRACDKKAHVRETG
jgi:hypothetical protein